MGKTLKDLELRLELLQARAAVEREAIAHHLKPWEKPLSWMDKGVDAFRFIKGNPVIWNGAFAILAHYKPKLASKVLAVGWGAMKLFKSTKRML